MILGAIVGTTAALGLLVSIFGDRYESSPEEVQDACDELINIQQNTLSAIADEIGQNVVIINNASNGYVDMSNMNAYVPAVEESIANLTGILDKQAQIIEEYNNGSLVEKMIGTGTMAILNLTEGVLKFGEDIVDAGANIISGVGTFCGFDMEEVELWAAKDHIGDAFDNAFENGALSWVEKYSIYSHESTAAEIIKGVGTAIPYIALAATGVGLVAEAGIAGAAGFGRGSTNYQQQHLVYDANGEASFDDTYSTGSMMWEGTKQGAVDAVLTVGMDKGFKALGKGISKLKAGKTAGEAGEKLLTEGTESAAEKGVTEVTESAAEKGVTEGSETVGKKLAKEADDNGKNVFEIYEETMSPGEKAKYENFIRKNNKTVPETAEQMAKKTSTELAEETAEKGVTEGSETVGKNLAKKADDNGKNVFEIHEETMSPGEKAKYENFIRNNNKTVPETAEQMAEETAEKTAQSGSKWQSPLQAQTPAAKVTKAYDDLVSNIKNTANSAKEKVNDVISNLKSSAGKTPADAGPRLGDNTISAKVTRAYDNAAAGLKNVGQKAGTAAKKVATDTARFVKENPKSALIGGGLIAAEKTIGNINTSYIPTDYASGEIKNFAATGNGETRIVIDDVDDITIPSTSPEQSASTGSTGSNGSNGSAGSGYSGGTYTPSSPDLKPTTGNTSENDDNKTPDDNKTIDPAPTPSKDENTVVSNPPSSNNNQSTSGVNHGGTTTNNNSGNNNWNSNSKTDSNNETTSELEPELEPELPIEDSDLIEEPDEEESVYTIPNNLSGVSETKKSSSGSGVLPVLGGLGAAAAIGVGAKMYLDNKKNNENGENEDYDGEFDEYSNDEFTDLAENNDLLADEWNGEDTEFNYEDSSGSSIVEPDDDDLGEM